MVNKARIKRGFESEAFIINETLALIAGDYNPRREGQEAPIGSIYFRTNGQIWQKFGNEPEDWNTIVRRNPKIT